MRPRIDSWLKKCRVQRDQRSSLPNPVSLGELCVSAREWGSGFRSCLVCSASLRGLCDLGGEDPSQEYLLEEPQPSAAESARMLNGGTPGSGLSHRCRERKECRLLREFTLGLSFLFFMLFMVSASLAKPQRRRETLHKGETAVAMRNTWGWKKDAVRVQHVVVLPCMSFMLFMAKSGSRSSWF
jgi:hypothetical protein